MLFRFKINIFFLRISVSRSGIHDICDARLGNNSSRLGTSDVLPDMDKNKNINAYGHWIIKLMTSCKLMRLKAFFKHFRRKNV